LASVAGELLARGHVRSGDALTIKGYIGNPDRITQAITKFAMRYADVTHDDYAALKKAIKSGKVKTAGATSPKK
jgi:hypothetical protein